MANNWLDVVAVDDVPEDDVLGVDCAGKDLALYSVEGQVYATDNICSHGHARLCDGFLEGFEIECPPPRGKFDPRDGRPTCEPVPVPVRTYPVKIEGGRVFVDLA